MTIPEKYWEIGLIEIEWESAQKLIKQRKQIRKECAERMQQLALEYKLAVKQIEAEKLKSLMEFSSEVVEIIEMGLEDLPLDIQKHINSSPNSDQRRSRLALSLKEHQRERCKRMNKAE